MMTPDNLNQWVAEMLIFPVSILLVLTLVLGIYTGRILSTIARVALTAVFLNLVLREADKPHVTISEDMFSLFGFIVGGLLLVLFTANYFDKRQEKLENLWHEKDE